MITTIDAETYKHHRKFLEERIEPNYGLLDKLLAKEALTNKNVQKIKKKKMYYRRNSKLLGKILDKGKCDFLTEALKETQQTHIINYLIGKGVREVAFGDEWPLSKREISILDVNCEILVDKLEMSELINRLFAAGVINDRQRDFITSKATSCEKNEAFLDILRRQSLNDYRKTIQCLHESHQGHIAIILEEAGDLFPIDSSEKEAEKEPNRIRRHKKFLTLHMEPDFGLLDELRANGSLTGAEIHNIMGGPYYKRNSKLLDHILNKRKCDQLIDALKATRQIHIVNYVDANGEHKPTFGDDWPLTERETSILTANHVLLVEELDTSSLLDHLFCAKVISNAQKEFIFSKKTSQKKNRTLLDILRRGSIRDYKETVRSLHESHQDHLAELLEQECPTDNREHEVRDFNHDEKLQGDP